MTLLAPNANASPKRFGGRRRGITLVELLIAVALTLVIVAAMVRAFKSSSDEITKGRAAMDMHTQLRSVVETLRSDLQNATCAPRVRGINDERSGYFEYVEGFEHDHDHVDADTNSYLGDHDDILALTIRSTDRPFRGRFNGAFVESYLAEVVWWAVHEDSNASGSEDYGDNIRLYRRVLLIRPDLTTSETNFDTYYSGNDVSVRRDGSGDLVMNTLEDLADRRNRFAHDSSTFPHAFMRTVLNARPLTGDFEGEDLMLAWSTGFDIKVFAPNTTVKVAGDQAVELTDPGYTAVSASLEQVAGGYVDLGHSGGWFDGDPHLKSQLTEPTYCTWSAAYEFDGIDQDGDNLFDEGVDGLDTDGVLGIDNSEERETQPPYPYPIRSMQITVRMIEQKTRQVIQKSIKESFVPN